MRPIRYILLAIMLVTLAVWFHTASGHNIFKYTESHVAVWIGDGAIVVHTNRNVLAWATNELPGCVNLIPPSTTWLRPPDADNGRFIVPFWLMLTVMSPPWLILHRRAREMRRRQCEGCCEACGYDLKGNESGVCSECGNRRPAGQLEGGTILQPESRTL